LLWGDELHAPGLLKTIGRIPALKSRDTLTVLNAGDITTTALLFPATRDAAVMAGSAGLLYVIARRAAIRN
jgi:hypothetical protein